MPLTLKLHDDTLGALTLGHEGGLLFRYVYAPPALATPPAESPRPYAHPLRSLRGDVLTNFRPNDHPWHHALSLTLTSVNGVNFWGGPTHAPADGYKLRDDHGAQIHREWLRREPGHIEHTLDWREQKTGRALLSENRILRARIDADESASAWTMRWTSTLENISGGSLTLGTYHALNGLAGSHYTGLQFRGARALLDDHGDERIALLADGGLSGEAAVHGASAAWMEWHTQHDTTLRRTRIRFENLGGPLHWFVRRHNPLAAFAFHRDQPCLLTAGATLTLDHQLTFADLDL